MARGEWRDRGHFSKAQIAKLERAMRVDKSVTFANSGIICLEHSSRTALEIRCETCRQVLPRDKFSRNSLRNGRNVSFLPCLCYKILPMGQGS